MRERANSPAVGRRSSANSRLRRILCCGVILLLAIPGFAIQKPDAEYVKSFEKWKAELAADLKLRWLVLAGLFWLKPGANTVGSASDNAVVLPSGPAQLGSFQLRGDEVSVTLKPGTGAKIGDKTETQAKLDSDVSGHRQPAHVCNQARSQARAALTQKLLTAGVAGVSPSPPRRYCFNPFLKSDSAVTHLFFFLGDHCEASASFAIKGFPS